MTTSITINPIISNPSPARAGKAAAPDIVNDGFFASFADLLDVINPLQHIPVVSSIYRELTDDTLSSGARVMGGALFGGPVGLFASIINEVMVGETGKDVGGNVFAAVSNSYQKTSSLT